jgi:UDP-3-O-[3-hydroxymyristoyl] glucosamine N-acyltransferase
MAVWPNDPLQEQPPAGQKAYFGCIGGGNRFKILISFGLLILGDMKFKVGEIAGMIGAQLEGDGELWISSLSKIEEGGPGSLTFLANPKYESFIYETQASAVIVAADFEPKQAIKAALLRTKDPYMAFAALLQRFMAFVQNKSGIEQPSFIAETAEIGQNVYIGAFAYIGHGAKVGDGAKIYPHAYVGDYASIGSSSTVYANATIYYGCKVGSHCIVHAGAVIGSDGFGFAPKPDGQFQKIPQTGIVRIEDHVEIGAGCTIDRATLGETIIRKGAKLDNLIQVAHNVEIGENTVIAAQTGISGSTKIGDNCMIGGQVGIVGHIKLADGTKIGAQSGVSKSVEEKGKALRGSPAQDYKLQLRSEAVFRNLDALDKRLHLLEKEIANRHP